MKRVSFYSAGHELEAVVRIPKSGRGAGVVIHHGYSGNKEEYDELGEYLCEKGFAVLQYDSQGTGKSSGIHGNLLCRGEWITDAVAAVSFLSGFETVDRERIGFTGCSMGGATTIAMGAMDPRVKRIAAMAPVGDGMKMLRDNWRRNSSEEKLQDFLEKLRTDLTKSSETGKTIADIPVMYALGATPEETEEYLRLRAAEPDMVANVTALSVWDSFIQYKPIAYVPYVSAPTMILHGSADELVSPDQGAKQYEMLRVEKEMVVLPGSPHNIPMWEGHMQAFEKIAQWFEPLNN